MKYFLLIADGMADSPQPVLMGKTPLSAARTPHMDAFAAAGTLGVVQTIPAGCVPGSDSGILTIFGYDPELYLTGRSALEAAGRDITLSPGQSACRCNFVTVQDGILISSSAGNLDAVTTQRLFQALCQDALFSALCAEFQVRFYPLAPYRLLCTGPSGILSAAQTTPPHEILNQPVMPFLPQSSPPLLQLMERARHILAQFAEASPATDIWPWAPGESMTLPSFSQEHGIQGVMISATPLALGIAKLAGLSGLCPPGATGTPHTDYAAKAQAAVRCFASGLELVCVHVEAPDECSHSQDLAGKIRAIEAIDREILEPVAARLSQCGEDFRILVLPDHRTLTATGCHDSAPVPYLLYDSSRKNGSGLCYSEATASETGIQIPDGTQLIRQFLY